MKLLFFVLLKLEFINLSHDANFSFWAVADLKSILNPTVLFNFVQACWHHPVRWNSCNIMKQYALYRACKPCLILCKSNIFIDCLFTLPSIIIITMIFFLTSSCKLYLSLPKNREIFIPVTVYCSLSRTTASILKSSAPTWVLPCSLLSQWTETTSPCLSMMTQGGSGFSFSRWECSTC